MVKSLIKDLTMLEKQNADKFNDVRYLHGFRFGVLEGFDEGYQRGVAYAIELIEGLRDRYECLPHEEYYISTVSNDLDYLIEQLKEQND